MQKKIIAAALASFILLSNGFNALAAQKAIDLDGEVVDPVQANKRLPIRKEEYRFYKLNNGETSADEIVSSYYYEYDVQGNVLSKVILNECKQGNSGMRPDIEAYKYDGQGNLLVKVNSYNSGSVYAYKYDGQGNVLEDISLNSDNIEAAIYEYDEKGDVSLKIMARNNYTRNDINKYNYIYAYDERGNVLSKVCEWDYVAIVDSAVCDQDSASSYYAYEYDGQGNVLARVHAFTVDDIGFNLGDIYEYDGQGNILSRTNTYASGDSFGVSTYTYDEQGNILKIHSYTYKNDKLDLTGITEYFYE